MAHYQSDSTSFSLISILGGPITSLALILGLFLILLGALLQTGVWAGMFGIIGALLTVLATTARFLIWLSRRL
jgi:hypothetical protein